MFYFKKIISYEEKHNILRTTKWKSWKNWAVTKDYKTTKTQINFCIYNIYIVFLCIDYFSVYYERKFKKWITKIIFLWNNNIYLFYIIIINEN